MGRRRFTVTPLEKDGTLSLLQFGDKQIYLIGTAHISSKSAEQVREVIHSVKPDTVFVELCPERAAKIWSKIKENEGKASTQRDIAPITGEEWMDELEYAKQFKRMNVRMLKFLEGFGFVYGGEFHAALEEANRIGAALVYGDRDVQSTMRRLNEGLRDLWSSLKGEFSTSWKSAWTDSMAQYRKYRDAHKIEGSSNDSTSYNRSSDGKTESFGRSKSGGFWDSFGGEPHFAKWFGLGEDPKKKESSQRRNKFEEMSTWEAMQSGWEESKKQRQRMKAKMPKNNWSEVLGLFTNPEETIEAMKDRQKIREKFESIRELAPDLVKGLVDERDVIMANNLKRCQGKVIVAVVGIGHMDGMESLFKNV